MTTDQQAKSCGRLQECHEAIERWLREEVALVYDKAKADPTLGIPVEKAFADIRTVLLPR